jgi:hypothetical protein
LPLATFSRTQGADASGEARQRKRERRKRQQGASEQKHERGCVGGGVRKHKRGSAKKRKERDGTKRGETAFEGHVFERGCF